MIATITIGSHHSVQPDFGHHSSKAGGRFLDAWGDGPMVLRFQGKQWRFEFSEMFGPVLLTKENEIAARQPENEDHPFWEPFNRWLHGGRKCRAVRNKRGKLRFYLCHIGKETSATTPSCQLVAEHVYSICAVCGREEIDMAECPQAKLGRQTFTGKEIERTEG